MQRRAIYQSNGPSRPRAQQAIVPGSLENPTKQPQSVDQRCIGPDGHLRTLSIVVSEKSLQKRCLLSNTAPGVESTSNKMR
jgi:hypothetical protein